MRYSAFALAALAAAGMASAQAKWVPLNSIKERPSKKAETPTPLSSQPTMTAARSPAMGVPPVDSSQALTAPSMAVAASPAGTNHPMEITCLGGGTANKTAVASAFGSSFGSGLIAGHSWSGSSFGSATMIGTRQQGFGDQIDIRIFNGDDRIRMPRTMLPWIHGGDHGWFKLKNVVADARSIRASAAVAMLNNPKVYIDRVTGTISISGKSGDFTGQCQAIDASAAPKF